MPEDIVRRAINNGVDILALTDHDDLSGLAAASKAANGSSLTFINGVEISIEWSSISIHIVALMFDPECQTLSDGLEEIRKNRLLRGERIANDFARIGIENTFKGALKFAQNPQLISRAHFARYLVEQKYAKNVNDVFERYLVPGKPGYVEHSWPSLEAAINWINAAGGIAIIAHPGRYKISSKQLYRLLEEFLMLGGQAIEVVSGSHSTDDIARFSKLAKHYNFFASRGSDFHSPQESHSDLGRLPQLADDLKPVWQLF